MNLKLESRLVFAAITILLMLLLTEEIYAVQNTQSGTKNYAAKASHDTIEPASQDKKVLKSFQCVVDEFATFFKTNPKFVAKHNALISYRGPKEIERSMVYIVRQYMFQEIAFDVRKTDSLVSPYTGFVDLIVDEKSNRACGDVKLRETTMFLGFLNIDDALAKGDDAICMKIDKPHTKERFEFAYQSNRWILKNIRFSYKDEMLTNDLLAAVFGMREDGYLLLTEPNGLSYNQKLYNFIKPYRE